MPPPESLFDDASILETIRVSGSEGKDAGIMDSVRFLGGVVKAIKHRREVDTGSVDLPEVGVYLLGEPPSDEGPFTKSHTARHGQLSLTGSVWYFNVDASVGSWRNDVRGADEWINHLDADQDLRARPCVVYMPTAPTNQVMFYPNGVAAPEKREYKDLREVDTLSLEDCNATLDHLCEEILSPPPGQFGSVRLWEDTTTYQAIEQAEKEIQGHIRTMILGRFPGLSPIEERITTAGRLDVGIVRNTSAGEQYLGLLELKVIREGKYSSSEIKEGIKQAASYQPRVTSPWAQVCCFDMRRQPPATVVPTSNQVQHATRRGVSIRNWVLNPSAQAVRDEEDRLALLNPGP